MFFSLMIVFKKNDQNIYRHQSWGKKNCTTMTVNKYILLLSPHQSGYIFFNLFARITHSTIVNLDAIILADFF